MKAVNRIEVEITAYGRGPDAVGRANDGRVVFVRGAVPGDTVRVLISEEHNSFLRGKVDTIIKPSPDRRETSCIHHTRDACGGCPWIATSQPRQQREKFEAVHREIKRVDQRAQIRPIRTEVPEWGYRRRTRLGYRHGVLGFRRRQERKIFNLETCLVLDPRINSALPAIRLEANKRALLHGSGNLDVVVDDHGRVHIGGVARIFRQPSATTETLLTKLVLEAIPSNDIHVAELFSGAGTFTEPLIQRGHILRAWEVDEHSVRQLKMRCPSADVERLDLFRHPARVNLQGVDSVLLDPPRAGAKDCMIPIAKSSASSIVYVSCDLATLCRDLRILTAHGLKVDYAVPVDAFPQTPHVETVVKLVRSTARQVHVQEGKLG